MRDLREFHDPALHLTIGGIDYTVTSPDADRGLRLRRMLSDAAVRWTDEEELAELATLLGATIELDEETGSPSYVGGTWEDMRSNGVSWPELVHAGRTALVYFGQSAALGEIYWETALTGSGNPMPPEPQAATGANRAARRAADKKAPAKKAPAKKVPATPAT